MFKDFMNKEVNIGTILVTGAVKAAIGAATIIGATKFFDKQLDRKFNEIVIEEQTVEEETKDE